MIKLNVFQISARKFHTRPTKNWEFSSLFLFANKLLRKKLLAVAKTRFRPKGPVKLIKRVKIAHSFLQSVSIQFHVIILKLPM